MEKSEIDKVDEARRAGKYLVVQTAPAIRATLGEEFGYKIGTPVTGQMVAALRRLGFNKVYDTNFGADLTIMEEANELLARIKDGGVLPMITSCSPGWINYAEYYYGDQLDHLSSCKSPMSMLSPVLKTLVPEHFGISRDNMVVVAIMPCTAKKYECKRPELTTNGKPDTDYVLTTQELGRMIKEAGINFNALDTEAPDSPFGEYTGAGTIFGASGGVAEAAARTAYEFATSEPLNDVDIKQMRGTSNRSRDIELDLKGTKLIIRVVSTLREAEKSLKEIKEGKAKFQMLEVMACPGGCINGGGQPRSCDDTKIKEERAQGLYKEDAELQYRKSHFNPSIRKLYNEYLEEPNSHKAHELLHTIYTDKFIGSYKDI